MHIFTSVFRNRLKRICDDIFVIMTCVNNDDYMDGSYYDHRKNEKSMTFLETPLCYALSIK